MHIPRLMILLAAALLARPAAAQPSFASGQPQGTLDRPEVNEASGLVASRMQNGVLWTHNDSGDAARVFAIADDARVIGAWTLPGVGAVDFEDIAIGPGPVGGVSYLYVGDIGDNAAARSSVIVHRVPEPYVTADPAAGFDTRPVADVETFTLTYEDGPRDAEAMFVDPISGDLFIASKASGESVIYRADVAALIDGASITLTRERTISLPVFFQLTTAADIAPAGHEIILRGYTFGRLWRRDPCADLLSAFDSASTAIPIVSVVTKGQGESVAFDALGRDYLTLAEGVGASLYRFARTSVDGPSPTTQLVERGEVWRFDDSGAQAQPDWMIVGFDDASWNDGAAPLGYGDGDEATTLGPARPVTTRFRRVFNVNDASSIARLSLGLHIDDGAVVYVNGVEVARLNVPAAADHLTHANAEADALEQTWRRLRVPSSVLQDGANVIAVEAHVASGPPDDLSFDAILVAHGDDPDCNDNGVPDACEIATGDVMDLDGDGRPDSCQCFGDADNDGRVNFSDLNAVLESWGDVGAGDVNGSGVTDFDDLNLVLNDWGRLCG